MTIAEHGTSAGWHTGCRCTLCRQAHSETQRAWGRARAQERLPSELRRQLLNAIYDGKPFRRALRDLGLSANEVWGLTRTDDDWSTAFDAPLTTTRREDLKHGSGLVGPRLVTASTCVPWSSRRWALAKAVKPWRAASSSEPGQPRSRTSCSSVGTASRFEPSDQSTQPPSLDWVSMKKR